MGDVDGKAHLHGVYRPGRAEQHCTVDAVAAEQAHSPVAPRFGDLQRGEHSALVHQPRHGRSVIRTDGARSSETADADGGAASLRPNGCSGVDEFALGLTGLPGFALLGQAMADLADAADLCDECITSLLGFGAEALERFDLPVTKNDRLEDLVVMDGEVVDASIGDRLGVLDEPRIPVPGIWKSRTCFSTASTAVDGSCSKIAVIASR